MPHPTEQTDPPPGILDEVLAWRVTPGRWVVIGQLLDALITAAGNTDDDALHRGLRELEVLGPVRITRLGATPVTPPPPEIRERINHLVHTMGAGSPDRSSGPDGGAACHDTEEEEERRR